MSLIFNNPLDALMSRLDLTATRAKDVVGRIKVSQHQNVYDADFEYGQQPLRWETIASGGATVTHLPGEGGVRLRLPTTSGAIAIRQSRPYHRYQPGKTMFMSSAVLFGSALPNQVNRVGIFDDGNGVFFEQIGATPQNPSGMGVIVRSDAGGLPVDIRVSIENWVCNPALINAIDWNRIQMIWIEYAWYGAGCVRWGVMINGEPLILHQIGFGNRIGQTRSWSRTGNLPVRYEQRNLGTTTQVNDIIHYGVSVVIEGGIDPQRGFTYSYGMSPSTLRRSIAINTTRFPVLNVRPRVMGTIEASQPGAAITAGTTTTLTAGSASWTINQWAGRMLSYIVAGTTYTARIISNTATTLTFADVVGTGALPVAPVSGGNYAIGLLNRGQITPSQLLLSSDAICLVELIASTPTSPIVLTNFNWQTLSSLGSSNSFAERDVSSTAMTGGEVVMAFTSPAGGSGLQQLDLSSLFPLLNTIRGDLPDILTVAISTANIAANVGAHFTMQEAMS